MGFVSANKLSRWPDGIIPYDIDQNGMKPAYLDTLNKAISAWNHYSPLILRKHQGETDYLTFKVGPVGKGGSNSGTAKQGQVFILMDFEWSEAGPTLLHEIGHVAGLIHEHQRPDRDHYVDYSGDPNIASMVIYYGGFPIGPYDCVSKMHYAENPDNFHPKPNMCATLGNNDYILSPGDVSALHFLSPYGVWWGAVGDEIITSAPSVSSWYYERLDVFARNANGTLGHRAFELGSWQEWKELHPNNPIKGRPAAVSWGKERIDVFVLGTDNRIYHTYTWDGSSWSDYDCTQICRFNETFSSSPCVVSPAPRMLDVFARGTDNALWHKGYDGNKWMDNWEPVSPDPIVGEPAAWAWEPGELNVVVLGTNNNLFINKKVNGYWGPYVPLDDHKFTSAPTVSTWGRERLDLFALGTDHALWHKVCANQQWGDWTPLGKRPLTLPPSAVSRGYGRVDVFVKENNKLTWIPVVGESLWWK